MAWRTQTTGGSFRPPGRTRGRESLAAGGESAGGNAVTQRGEIFLGRGGRAGFGVTSYGPPCFLHAGLSAGE